ncbi:MAG: cyclic nucleotide-binding domain-containing protein [Candidatus Goldbacteria bacterium]|nr:cyclic nucleotide-binding domain-containing protein [Candidatus Goldiibacteriota bacterium]
MPNIQDDFSMLRNALQKVDFFYNLSFGELDELIQALRKRKAKKGEKIIKQGEIGDKFYIIGSGEVSVHIKKGLISNKVATLTTGDFFGEMALITDLPRTATVIAEEPTELFVLDKADFKKILMKNPKISSIINETLTKRLSSNK